MKNLDIQKLDNLIKKRQKYISLKKNKIISALFRLKLILAPFLSKIFTRILIWLTSKHSHDPRSFSSIIKKNIWTNLNKRKFGKDFEFIVNNHFDQISYIINSNENSLNSEIFVTGDYEKRYFDEALNILEITCNKISKMNFFDVGANIGTFTLLASNSKKFQRIIAIEPHPTTYKNLIANINLNKCLNIKTFNCAIDYELNEIQMEISSESSGDNRVRIKENNLDEKNNLYKEELRETIIVPCKTLQEIIINEKIEKQEGINLFWIDVQGAESRVLNSIDPSYLDESIFVLEIWEYGLKRLGGSLKHISQLLSDHIVININFDHDYPFGCIEIEKLILRLRESGSKDTNTYAYDLMFIPKKLISNPDFFYSS